MSLYNDGKNIIMINRIKRAAACECGRPLVWLFLLRSFLLYKLKIRFLIHNNMSMEYTTDVLKVPSFGKLMVYYIVNMGWQLFMQTVVNACTDDICGNPNGGYCTADYYCISGICDTNLQNCRNAAGHTCTDPSDCSTVMCTNGICGYPNISHCTNGYQCASGNCDLNLQKMWNCGRAILHKSNRLCSKRLYRWVMW